MNKSFEIAGGSVVGREHLRIGRNNQDAFHWVVEKNRLVAVVTDGCGSSKHSEVGAKIGARLTASAVLRQLDLLDEMRHYRLDPATHPFWEEVQRDILQKLAGLVFSGSQTELLRKSAARMVNDCFLFTLLGVLITPEDTSIFSIGDGFYAVNERIVQLGPFPNNEPPYLAYEFTSPSLLKIHVHQKIPTEAVQSLLIGTDGLGDLITAAETKMSGKNELVGPLSQFWENARFFKNPDMVRRRLALINRDVSRIDWDAGEVHKENGLLPDDTTLVVIRRKE